MSVKVKNLLIVLVGAFVVAVLVALMVQMTMGGKKQEQQVVEEAKVQILVASKDLSLGDELKAEDARWQSWPKAALFTGAIVRKDKQKTGDVLEGRLARNIAKDEPLTRMALLAEAKGNFVAASLDPGMRALAIEVSASSMVGGFIGPGDFVDIVLTYKQTIRVDNDDALAKQIVSKNLDKLATETIVQNARILAVDQMATRPEDDKVKVGKTVTVALNTQYAERVALAQEMGALTLILRGVGDEAIVEKSWPTVSDVRMTSVDDEIYAEYDRQKQDTGGTTKFISIYNGDQLQRVPAP